MPDVTKTINRLSGPPKEGEDPEKAFYVMSTSNVTESEFFKPVAKYDTISARATPDQFENSAHIIVFTPSSDGSVFLTLQNNNRNANAGGPSILTIGYGRPGSVDGIADKNGVFASKAFMPDGFGSNQEALQYNGIISQTDTMSGFQFQRKKADYTNDNVERVSESQYRGNDKGKFGTGVTLINAPYSSFPIRFSPAGNVYSPRSFNGPPVELLFYKDISPDDVAALIQMLDINNADSNAFQEFNSHAEFKLAYTEFLDSVGALLKEGVAFKIRDAIGAALGGESSDGFKYRTPVFTYEAETGGVFSNPHPASNYFQLNPSNETIDDDLREVKNLKVNQAPAARRMRAVADQYTAWLTKEKQMLKTMLDTMKDLDQIVTGDGSVSQNNTNTVFGKFAKLYGNIMDELWNRMSKDPSKRKKSGGGKGKGKKDSPKTIVDRTLADQEEAKSAGFAENQILKIKTSNTNFFGAHQPFEQPMSVLDIIRDETTYPQATDTLNVEKDVLPDNKDKCSDYFNGLDIQATLDTMKLLKLQLCTNRDLIGDILMDIKRFQLSADFRLAGLFIDLPAFHMPNFGLPAFGVTMPNWAVPNFGVPDLSLPDFGFPNIGLDLPSLSLPNIDFPEITFPEITIPNIPGVTLPKIGGINIPSFQAFNFDWDNINFTIPKFNIDQLTFPDISLKVQIPKNNWEPDLNFSALRAFSNPFSCDGDINITIPKLSISRNASCDLAAQIVDIIQKPKESISKLEDAKKQASTTVKRYQSYIDDAKGLMGENGKIAEQLTKLSKIVLAKQEQIQAQAADQITSITNSVQNPAGGFTDNVSTFGTAGIERGKASLTQMFDATDAAKIPLNNVSI